MGNATGTDCVQARYMLCVMLFFGFMVTFMLRVNINLAIVSMVRPSNVTSQGDAEAPAAACQLATPTLGNLTDAQDAVPTTVGEFEWDELQQSIVLGSFFWGYLLFQVPGGRIAEVYGTKRVFGGAIFLNGMLALALPTAARLHWSLLLVIRACQGLAQGVLFPALSAAVVRWVPLAERARFVSFAVQGASLGVVLSLPLCGFILDKWGWEAVFYVSGLCAVGWTLAWSFLVYDTPELHPRITDKERLYITEQLSEQTSEKRLSVPWRSVMTSSQFWIGCVAAFGNDWGFHTFTTLAPKYITGSLGFNAVQSSWLTSLPFLCQYVFAMIYGTFADCLLQRSLTLVQVRKLSIIVSHVMPAALLVGLSMAGCNVILSIVLLTLSVTVIGAFSSGFYQNPLDIAPNFAGFLTGIMNGIGSGAGVISTPIAGIVLHSTGSAGWSVIFLIAAVMYTLSSIPYIIFAKAEILPWNDTRQADKEKQVPMLNVVRDKKDEGELDTLSNKVA